MEIDMTMIESGTLMLRNEVGTAKGEDGQDYELTTGMGHNPNVRSELTGKTWAFGWAELIALAVEYGIDEEGERRFIVLDTTTAEAALSALHILAPMIGRTSMICEGLGAHELAEQADEMARAATSIQLKLDDLGDDGGECGS